MRHKVKGSFSYSGPERRKSVPYTTGEKIFFVTLCAIWVLVPSFGPNIVGLWAWLKEVISLGHF